MTVAQDLRGQKFGWLTVIERIQAYGSYSGWLCKCICGKHLTVSTFFLHKAKYPSCGCAQEVIPGRGVDTAVTARLLDLKRRAFELNVPIYPDEFVCAERLDHICEDLNAGRTVIRGDMPASMKKLYAEWSLFRIADDSSFSRLTLDPHFRLIQIESGYWRPALASKTVLRKIMEGVSA